MVFCFIYLFFFSFFDYRSFNEFANIEYTDSSYTCLFHNTLDYYRCQLLLLLFFSSSIAQSFQGVICQNLRIQFPHSHFFVSLRHAICHRHPENSFSCADGILRLSYLATLCPFSLVYVCACFALIFVELSSSTLLPAAVNSVTWSCTRYERRRAAACNFFGPLCVCVLVWRREICSFPVPRFVI